MKNYLLILVALLCVTSLGAAPTAREYSKAGFFEVKDGGRKVINFNLGWRLFKGVNNNAQATNFDDSTWKVVNTPNGVQYDPSEASGGVNYRGEAWYRKHFKIDPSQKGKTLKIHFEAVMGKSKVWLNGNLLCSHFGGYNPFTVDLNEYLNYDGENVIAVWTDNSDDDSYAPGKPQDNLDMVYFPGIYRDVWLLETNNTYITDANQANKVAGGGVFFSITEFSKELIKARVDVDIQNDTKSSNALNAEISLLDKSGAIVASATQKVNVKGGKSAQVTKELEIKNPKLWTPTTPTLYRLEVKLTGSNGTSVDAVALRVGLRKLEFKGKDGFYLNEEPYEGKLMGGNRHQDFAYVGYALPNNIQWRDAVIMKQGGCEMVRAAHYAADPAFMDACDEIGLFFIVATPGWQYWNETNPIFTERVYNDVRDMVRRDRNRPSVLLWEAVLNESKYPDTVSEKMHYIVHEEYPYPGAYTVCDRGRYGHKVFDVVFSKVETGYEEDERAIFQREWGSIGAANTPNRLQRSEGEYAQLFQAKQYAFAKGNIGSYETLCDQPRQHFGGAVWHYFDHQAGCHSVPFYGGLTDVFRQTKYSYYMFAAQRNISETFKPMVYIAHEQMQYSPDDIVVYTNCEEVRLTINGGTMTMQKNAIPRETYKAESGEVGKWEDRDKTPKKSPWRQKNCSSIPHPPVLFTNAFSYGNKDLPINKQGNFKGVVAEGIVGGKVVATDKRGVFDAPAAIRLRLADEGTALTADGSDFVVVVAEIVDKNGTIMRQSSEVVKFEVNGEGAIIGDESISANPRRVEWGTAPILVRATNKAGKITVNASIQKEGSVGIKAGTLTFESVPSGDCFNFIEVGKE